MIQVETNKRWLFTVLCYSKAKDFKQNHIDYEQTGGKELNSAGKEN